MKKYYLFIALFACVLIGFLFYLFNSRENEKNNDRSLLINKINNNSTQNLMADKPGVLQLGLMVHLEGWNDSMNEDRYLDHVAAMERYGDLFDKYNAKLTLETIDVIDGEIKWGGNVLEDLEERGHGIGVHADVGGTFISYSDFVLTLREMKNKAESLGLDIKHVSGICSREDWVSAAADAGYGFTTGNVAYCTQPMTLKDRPEEYKNCKTPATCHQIFPADLEERTSPWYMEDGSNWLDKKTSGKLVIFPSSGLLKCMAEYETSGDSLTDCEFTQEDIDASIGEFEKAVALTDKNTVSAYYLAVSLGKELDNSLLENWLIAIQGLVDDGSVEWKTIPEMYQEYINSASLLE